MKLPTLNPIFMSELRLSIVALLNEYEEIDFLYIQEITGASSGNISVQLDKLSKAGYIEIHKSFVDKKTRTTCSLTELGRKEFASHYKALKSYFK